MMNRRPIHAWLAVVLFAGFVFLPLAAMSGDVSAGQSAERWSKDELATLASLRLSQLPAPPLDPSNAYEGSTLAATLGQRLFVDTRMSRNQAVSCATCHDPARQFQDGKPVSQGVGTGTRRAMPIADAGRGPWLFWDGRKDSLWSQALGPLEDAVEHGGSRTRYVHLVAQHHRDAYVNVFGSLPDLGRLPLDASPLGNEQERAAWQSMDAASRDAVNRIFANIGKAIAAYEKRITHGESRVDRYIEALVQGQPSREPTLDDKEIRGLRLFIGKAQCIGCHNGPLLTDQHFHNTGVPQRDAAHADRGRAAGLQRLQQDEFNCLGRYSDAKPEQCGELRFLALDDRHMEGAFKTPGLRDVALRPPYMHAGQVTTLDAVVRHYVDAPPATVGHSELTPASRSAHGDARQPIRLTAAEQQDLVALLKALSAVPAP
jgi:cytochrome c peroxidase